MWITRRHRPAIFAPVLLGGALLGLAETGHGAHASQVVPCELRVSALGGSIAIEGMVLAQSQIAGGYHLTVSRSGASGSTAIEQSGEFSAAASGPVRLGSVTLDAGGGPYEARLTVTVGNRTIECTKRSDGTL